MLPSPRYEEDIPVPEIARRNGDLDPSYLPRATAVGHSQEWPTIMSSFDQSGIDHAIRLIRPLLERASPTFLDDLRRDLDRHGIPDAVARHDSEPIFDWLMGLIQLQGISDRAAFAYVATHGNVTWAEVNAAVSREPSCARLKSFWHFDGCGYRKSVGTCSEPEHIGACPLPRHPLRKGTLNQASYHLALFIRDACDGDIVGWLDGRLAGLNFEAEPRSGNLRSQTGLLTPLQPGNGLCKRPSLRP